MTDTMDHEEAVRRLIRDIVDYALKHGLVFDATSKPGVGSVQHRFRLTVDIPAVKEPAK